MYSMRDRERSAVGVGVERAGVLVNIWQAQIAPGICAEREKEGEVESSLLLSLGQINQLGLTMPLPDSVFLTLPYSLALPGLRPR